MQSLIDFLSAHPSIALAAVFAASLLEALAVIGTVIPGSTIVFAGGVLIGLQVLGPWSTPALAITGAILGDGISYWLGHRYHERIRVMWPMRRYPALFDRGQEYFDKNGGRSVFVGRFLGPLRAIVPVIAGMSNMAPARFYAMNVLSAVAWSAAHILPGMLFGASLQLAGAVSSRLGGEPRPLWNAMVTSERLRRPAGLMTISTTSRDFAAAAQILAEDMRKQRVPAATRERGGLSVLLLW